MRESDKASRIVTVIVSVVLIGYAISLFPQKSGHILGAAGLLTLAGVLDVKQLSALFGSVRFW